MSVVLALDFYDHDLSHRRKDEKNDFNVDQELREDRVKNLQTCRL